LVNVNPAYRISELGLQKKTIDNTKQNKYKIKTKQNKFNFQNNNRTCFEFGWL